MNISFALPSHQLGMNLRFMPISLLFIIDFAYQLHRTMGNVHALAHRVTAMSVAVLATAGFIFCLLAGFGCNYLSVNPMPGRVVITPDGLEFATEDSAYLGIQCDSPFHRENDRMWNMSQLFLYIGLIVGGVTTLLAWVVSVLIPPTNITWRSLSVLSACAAVIEVPIFLIFESEPCTIDINRQTCAVATGGILNIVSITLFVGMTIWTQCLNPPDWTKETEAWRNTDRQVKVGEISIPSGDASKDENETAEETLPRDASPRAPQPPMYWHMERKVVQNFSSEERRRSQEVDVEQQEEDVTKQLFENLESTPPDIEKPENVSNEDEHPEQEHSLSSFWKLRKGRSSSSKRDVEEKEEVHHVTIKDVEALTFPTGTQDENQIEKENQPDEQLRPSFWTSRKSRSVPNKDESHTRNSFWTLGGRKKDAAEDKISIANEAVEKDAQDEQSECTPVSQPRPIYSIPLSWDAEDIEIPLPPREVFREETLIIENKSEREEKDEPKSRNGQVRPGGSMMIASLKGKTQALTDRVRKASHKETAQIQKSNALKFTIICPDGTEEKKNIGPLNTSSVAERTVEKSEHPYQQNQNVQPLEDKMRSRDFVVTHSIARTHASVPLEREDTILKHMTNTTHRVQSNPVRARSTSRRPADVIPPESLSIPPPSNTMSFDAVSEMTPAVAEHEPILEETLDILEDLARLER